VAGISPLSMINNDIPFAPSLNAFTKQEFNRGSMTNGVHSDRWIKLEVTLYHAERARHCHSCGRTIEAGQVYGSDFTYSDSFCRDCIEMPGNVEAWKISYKMQRRSTRNPNGIRTIYAVNTPEALGQYVAEISVILSRPVNAQKVWPLSEIVPSPALAAGEPIFAQTIKGN
jgi:hypothetical protein